MDAVNPLNYAPRPRVAQRFWRWVYRLIFLAAILAAAVEWGPGLCRHAESMYWEEQCLTFLQPSDHVVYEMNGSNVLHSETCAQVLRLMDTALNPAMPQSSIIFLHAMRRPDGTRCLLSLTLIPNPPQGGDFGLQYLEWTVSFSPRVSNWNLLMAETIRGPELSRWRFFAGQPDTNNPSHFTFDYELNAKRFTCDAWLNDDGRLIVWRRP